MPGRLAAGALLAPVDGTFARIERGVHDLSGHVTRCVLAAGRGVQCGVGAAAGEPLPLHSPLVIACGHTVLY